MNLFSIKAANYERSLAAFCQRAWREVDPAPLDWNWHHDLICEWLQLAYERRIRRLDIEVPPRTGKSRVASILFPAWSWIREPRLKFIGISYSDSLATELSVARRNLFSSRFVQRNWPGRITFAPDQNQKQQYENTSLGQMIATSMGGTVSGKGGDFILLDDPLNPQAAFSELERNACNRAYDATVRSRLNQPDAGVIVIIAQRTHQVDLIGHVTANEPDLWSRLRLSMVAEEDEEIRFPISGRIVRRKVGDLLWPSRFSREWCSREAAAVGPFVWRSQYQQLPIPKGGAVFRDDWLRYYDTPPTGLRSITQSWDCAVSTKSSADYSVGTCWGQDESGNLYLLALVRGRFEYPELRQRMIEFHRQWRAERILIEKASAGHSVAQELIRGTSLPIVSIDVDRDKLSRAMTATVPFSNGKVFFPQRAAWLPELVSELLAFSDKGGGHDDQVDSLTMAINHLQSGVQRYTLIEWYKQQQAKEDKASIEAKKPAEVNVPACSACGSTFIQRIPGGKRCGQCGFQFNGVKSPPETTRRDILRAWRSGTLYSSERR